MYLPTFDHTCYARISSQPLTVPSQRKDIRVAAIPQQSESSGSGSGRGGGGRPGGGVRAAAGFLSLLRWSASGYPKAGPFLTATLQSKSHLKRFLGDDEDRSRLPPRRVIANAKTFAKEVGDQVEECWCPAPDWSGCHRASCLPAHLRPAACRLFSALMLAGQRIVGEGAVGGFLEEFVEGCGWHGLRVVAKEQSVVTLRGVRKGMRHGTCGEISACRICNVSSRMLYCVGEWGLVTGGRCRCRQSVSCAPDGKCLVGIFRGRRLSASALRSALRTLRMSWSTGRSTVPEAWSAWR